MSQITEQKCPECGAPLRFDPASGKLVCDYCGTVTDLPKAQKKASAAGRSMKKPAGDKTDGQTPPVSEEKTSGTSDDIEVFDFESLTDQATDPYAMDLPVYNCVSCGAEVIAPAEQAALTCPYCGNNIVLTEKLTGKLRPDGVIPFKIRSDELPAAVNSFYKDKKLLPRHFFSKSTMGHVTGVYVPFWVFSGDVGGRLTYRAQTSSSSRKGDYIITQTSYYSLVRDAAMSFDNLPVDASGRIDDRLMDSLEPFHTSEAQPFDMRYLAGFTADRFDQKKGDISKRASDRMKNSAYSIVSAQASSGYTSVTENGERLNAKLHAKYILFPVYMFDISFEGKNYHFAVNGQTGKVVGNLPTSDSSSVLYFLKNLAIVSGGLIAISIAKYMLGM